MKYMLYFLSFFFFFLHFFIRFWIPLKGSDSACGSCWVLKKSVFSERKTFTHESHSSCWKGGLGGEKADSHEKVLWVSVGSPHHLDVWEHGLDSHSRIWRGRWRQQQRGRQRGRGWFWHCQRPQPHDDAGRRRSENGRSLICSDDWSSHCLLLYAWAKNGCMHLVCWSFCRLLLPHRGGREAIQSWMAGMGMSAVDWNETVWCFSFFFSLSFCLFYISFLSLVLLLFLDWGGGGGSGF